MNRWKIVYNLPIQRNYCFPSKWKERESKHRNYSNGITPWQRFDNAVYHFDLNRDIHRKLKHSFLTINASEGRNRIKKNENDFISTVCCALKVNTQAKSDVYHFRNAIKSRFEANTLRIIAHETISVRSQNLRWAKRQFRRLFTTRFVVVLIVIACFCLCLLVRSHSASTSYSRLSLRLSISLFPFWLMRFMDIIEIVRPLSTK